MKEPRFDHDFAHLGRLVQVGWSFGSVLLVGLVCRRAFGPPAPFGGEGAQYIEREALLDVLAALAGHQGLSPWGILVAADRAFPPILHLLAAPLAVVLGPDAAVPLVGLLAWAGLAAAVGSVAQSLRPGSGLTAAVGVALLPAVHGAATRYYYDLPGVALLWAALAVALGGRDTGRRGAAAGLIWLAAALTKWPFAVFGLPLMAAAALPPWRRRRTPATAALVLAVGSAAFVAASGEGGSWYAASSTALDDPSAGAGLLSVLRSAPQRLGLAELAFYPARLMATVLGPAVFAAALVLLTAARQAVPWRLLALVGGGHLLFLWAFVPLLDDRFLLPFAPALAVAVAAAWSASPRPARLALVAAAALAAVDLHAGLPAAVTPAVPLLVAERDGLPPTVLRGLGPASSMERRGWSRADEDPEPRQALRDAGWAALPTGPIGLPPELRGIDAHGDAAYWRYRAKLEAGPEFVEGCAAWTLLGAPLAGAPRPPCPGLVDPVVVPDPDGGPGLVLWRDPAFGIP